MSNMPTMPVGKYAGKPVDQIPNDYLRWLVTQKFPPEILEAAKEKLSHSDYNDSPFITVTRHAADMFSKRFLDKWLFVRDNAIEDKYPGIISFIEELSETAYEHGEDVSLHRHETDGVRRLYDGMIFVYAMNDETPEYKKVITIFAADDDLSTS